MGRCLSPNHMGVRHPGARCCHRVAGVSDLVDSADHNPAQREVLEHLGASRDERPVFDDQVRVDLTLELEKRLAPVIEPIGDDTVFVSKHALTSVLGCERRYLAERNQPFIVTVPITRGVVSHKAIELGLHWQGERTPMHMVDEAIARLENDESWVSDFLRTCSEAERAELKSDAVERVTKFDECWPRLKPTWKPVTESTMVAELLSGRVILRGKVDLTIGRSEGMRAGKVLVDLKSGRTVPHHLDDLRFYALVETLRIGTPPRRLATYYLDQGRFLPEDVTEDLLRSTVLRVCAGVERMVELRDAVGPGSEWPGPNCHWCNERLDCESGQRYVADETDQPGV